MAGQKKPQDFAKPKPKAKAKARPKMPPIVPPPTEEEELAALEQSAVSEIKTGLEVLREIASGVEYEPTERVSAAKALIAYGSSQIVHVRKVRSTAEKPQEKIAQLTLFDFPISK